MKHSSLRLLMNYNRNIKAASAWEKGYVGRGKTGRTYSRRVYDMRRRHLVSAIDTEHAADNAWTAWSRRQRTIAINTIIPGNRGGGGRTTAGPVLGQSRAYQDALVRRGSEGKRPRLQNRPAIMPVACSDGPPGTWSWSSSLFETRRC